MVDRYFKTPTGEIRLVVRDDVTPDPTWQYLPDGLPKRPVTSADVDAESNRRIVEGTSFTILGNDPVRITGRPEDRMVLTAQHTRALSYIADGKPEKIMVFRCADNHVHNLTAMQMKTLAEDGFKWVEDTYQVRWNMKDLTNGFSEGIPEDYTDDKHWPKGSADVN